MAGVANPETAGYGPGRTRAGVPCPWCKREDAVTQHCAIVPMADQSDIANPRIINPHQYAVCDDCHREQYKLRYKIDRPGDVVDKVG